jgi:hypothetical protein
MGDHDQGTGAGPPDPCHLDLEPTIVVDTWVSDHCGDPHAEVHPHHPAA